MQFELEHPKLSPEEGSRATIRKSLIVQSRKTPQMGVPPEELAKRQEQSKVYKKGEIAKVALKTEIQISVKSVLDKLPTELLIDYLRLERGELIEDNRV
jgi:hypothetical protein